MNVQMDCGAVAGVEITHYPGELTCSDISLAFPVTTISVCGNEDKVSVVGLLGLSAEWEIITAEDAPIQKGYHYEMFPSGVTQFVEECTYAEKKMNSTNKELEGGTKEKIEKVEVDEEESIVLNQTYFTKYGMVNAVTCWDFSFAYPDNWVKAREGVKALYADDKNVLYTPGDELEYMGLLTEVFVIENERGVEIQYVDLKCYEENSRDTDKYEVKITQVGASILETYPLDGIVEDVYMPTYIVAKIEILDKQNTESIENRNVREIYYAVIPSEYLGEYDGLNSSYYEGIKQMYFEYKYHSKQDLISVISEEVQQPYAFFAKSPDGIFTEQEEKEIIAILGSFRTGIYEQDIDLYDNLQKQFFKEYCIAIGDYDTYEIIYGGE